MDSTFNDSVQQSCDALQLCLKLGNSVAEERCQTQLRFLLGYLTSTGYLPRALQLQLQAWVRTARSSAAALYEY